MEPKVRRGRRSRRSGIVLAAALLLAACGAVDDGTEVGGSAVEPGDDTGTTSGVGIADAADGEGRQLAESWDDDATFTFAYSVDTTGWEPNGIATNNSYLYLHPIYDTLIHINENAAPEPLLAESWELVEPNVLELELIEGWSFHDGTPFDAEAVKANLDHHRSVDGGFNVDRMRPITEVEVVDARTVRVHTDGPASPMVGILGSSAGMMMSPKVLDDPSQRTNPTGGSGAYRLVNYVPGSRAEYERVEDYWDRDRARVARLVILISNDDNARLNFVITGGADATFLRPPMVPAAKGAGLQIIERPSLSTYIVGLNTSLSEFGDKRVRQALNYAIDREAIGRDLMDGYCEPAGGVFPEWYWAGTPDVSGDRFARDLDKARQLLAEAGLPDGFSFRLHGVNIALWQQIAEVLQSNWAEIGVDVEIVAEDVGAMVSGFRDAKTTAALLTELKGESDPSVTTAQLYLPTSLSNPGGLQVPELERLHVEAMQGATPEERAPAYAQLLEVAAEESPHLTICSLTTPFASTDEVQDLPVPADGTRWFRGVSIKE